MAIREETLLKFLAELGDTIQSHGGELGNFEIVIRGKSKEAAIATAALRSAITVDLVMGRPQEFVLGKDFQCTLEGVSVKIEREKDDPRLRHGNPERHRMVTIHSSQLWRLVRLARTMDTDEKAYTTVLRDFFPVLYTHLFEQPQDFQTEEALKK